jgi:hypothetical protein
MFLFLYLPYAYFNHSDGWNQRARFAELHAIVLHRTFAIDAYQGITGDKGLLNGHYYSEKAPATTLMALPAFALTVFVQERMGIDPDSEAGWRVSEWTTTAGSIAVLAALGGVAFFALLRRRFGQVEAHIATVAVFLGTLTLPYAASLFAHAGTIGLLAITFWCVLGDRPPSKRLDYLGGICAGLAIASEYPAVIPLGCLLLYLMASSMTRSLRVVSGMVPGLLLILMKNYAVTGSPVVLAYGFNPGFATVTAQNSFGFGLPSVDTVRALLWGEYRGLMFWSPVLLMAVPGLFVLAQADSALAVTLLAGIVLVTIQAASFSGWFGGNAVSARYLAPAVPLLGLSAAHGIARFPRIGTLVTLVSVLLMTMVVAVAIDPPQDVTTPFTDYYLARLQQDRLAPNLGSLLGLSPAGGLLLLAGLLVILGLLMVRAASRTSAIGDQLSAVGKRRDQAES